MVGGHAEAIAQHRHRGTHQILTMACRGHGAQARILCGQPGMFRMGIASSPALLSPSVARCMESQCQIPMALCLGGGDVGRRSWQRWRELASSFTEGEWHLIQFTSPGRRPHPAQPTSGLPLGLPPPVGLASSGLAHSPTENNGLAEERSAALPFLTSAYHSAPSSRVQRTCRCPSTWRRWSFGRVSSPSGEGGWRRLCSPSAGSVASTCSRNIGMHFGHGVCWPLAVAWRGDFLAAFQATVSRHGMAKCHTCLAAWVLHATSSQEHTFHPE